MLRPVLYCLFLWSLCAPATAEVVQANSKKLAQLIEQGVPVIDIRTAGEWKTTGVVKDSRLMTFFDEQGRYDIPGWLTRLADIAPPGQPVAIICQSGSRSMMLTHYLDTQAGYSGVINVTRGIGAWVVEGYPTMPAPANP